ncbi:CD151 antigen-like [Schistocerca nitens]|uniref:CD151 antigen-like n=1 Tax=Schistocerca nitens TaxID=7011 RepID=UPI002118E18D|nr:CD151 antigen-like [Schistocerca nitens]
MLKYVKISPGQKKDNNGTNSSHQQEKREAGQQRQIETTPVPLERQNEETTRAESPLPATNPAALEEEPQVPPRCSEAGRRINIQGLVTITVERTVLVVRVLVPQYFALLFALLLSELSLSVAALLARRHVAADLQQRLQRQLAQRYGLESQANGGFTQAVDVMQYKFHCCGIRDDSDYLHTRWKNESASSNSYRRNVPLTCCTLANTDTTNSGSPISVVSRAFSGTVEEPWQTPNPVDERACQDNNDASGARHSRGCYLQLEAWFKTETTILIAVGISTAAFQVIGMVISLFLCQKLGDDV